MFELLETLSKNSVISNEPAKNLLEWVLKTFRDVLPMCDASFAMDTASSSPTNQDVAKLEAKKKKRADMAARRRAKIMNQMSKMQKQFIEDNSELFQSTSTEAGETDMELG